MADEGLWHFLHLHRRPQPWEGATPSPGPDVASAQSGQMPPGWRLHQLGRQSGVRQEPGTQKLGSGRPHTGNRTVSDPRPPGSDQMDRPGCRGRKQFVRGLSISSHGDLLWDCLPRLCRTEALSPSEVMHSPHPSLLQKGPTRALKQIR